MNKQFYILQINLAFVFIQFKCQSVLFDIRQIELIDIDKTQFGATIPSQSEPGSNGNERVLHIPPIS